MHMSQFSFEVNRWPPTRRRIIHLRKSEKLLCFVKTVCLCCLVQNIYVVLCKTFSQLDSNYLVYKVTWVTYLPEHTKCVSVCTWIKTKIEKSFLHCTKWESLLAGAALQLRGWAGHDRLGVSQEMAFDCLPCPFWRAAAWSSQNSPLQRQNPSISLHSILLQFKRPKPHWVYQNASSAWQVGIQTSTHLLETTDSSRET